MLLFPHPRRPEELTRCGDRLRAACGSSRRRSVQLHVALVLHYLRCAVMSLGYFSIIATVAGYLSRRVWLAMVMLFSWTLEKACVRASFLSTRAHAAVLFRRALARLF
mmetsp:Transcript_16581/g.42570  ORF Transcript_16581/g.42570 Transcript_16581/m.42570 type:complete len:108 (+) Transcript_16581:1739-2062(+)